MSGPKSSRYTLTAEQRRILAQQRELALRKARAADQIRRGVQELARLANLESEKKIAAAMTARHGSDSGLTAAVHEAETAVRAAHALVAATDMNHLAQAEEAAAQIAASLTEARQRAGRIAAIAARNESALREDVQAALGKPVRVSFANLSGGARLSPAMQAARDQAMEELRLVQRAEGLSQTLRQEMDEALHQLESTQDEAFMKNILAVMARPLLRRAEAEAEAYAARRDTLRALESDYAALCAIHALDAQTFPCTEEGIAALREEIRRIQAETAQDNEQAYIAQALDEVMQEMGYAVLGSREVVKRSGKRFRHELYDYGDGTAMNVTYAAGGRIAMELGGLDESDRLPDSHETVALCDAMGRFCGDFGEIERRLLARGVTLAQRISLLPPEPAYAQIINTADYDMRTRAQRLDVRRESGSARISMQKE